MLNPYFESSTSLLLSYSLLTLPPSSCFSSLPPFHPFPSSSDNKEIMPDSKAKKKSRLIVVTGEGLLKSNENT